MYDLVAAIFIQFADPAMRASAVRQHARALRPGGLLVLQGLPPRQLQYRSGGPQRIDHLYTEEMLREAFAAAGSSSCAATTPSCAEGTQHTGNGRTRRQNGGAQALSRSAPRRGSTPRWKAAPAAMLAHQPIASASGRDAAGLRKCSKAALTSR